MAGTIDAPGNISYGDTSPADGVEWNVGADPDAMAAVLALDVPITLVGLDATDDVPVPADIVDQLASDHAAAGADIAYEMYARTPFLADSGNSYWDPLAAVTLTDPSVAGWEDMTLAMEPTGPAAGHLVRDRGRPAGARRDVGGPRRLHGRLPRRPADRRATGASVRPRRVDVRALGRQRRAGSPAIRRRRPA